MSAESIEPIIELGEYPADPAVSETPEESEVPTEAEIELIYEPGEETAPAMDIVKRYLREIGKVPLLNAEEEVYLARQIEAGLYATNILTSEAGRLAIEQASGDEVVHMSPEYKQDLETIAVEGDEALKHFYEANLRLVVSIAKKYQGRGMDLLDIIQEGNLGLDRALKKFDYQKGFKFSTYATWWIRQAITRSLADQGRTIRIPVHMGETINKMRRIQRDYYNQEGDEAPLEHVAKELDLEPDKVKDLIRIGRDTVSLDDPLTTDSDFVRGDFVSDRTANDPYDDVDDADTRVRVEFILEQVLTDERSRYVIIRRFGLDRNPPATLDSVGHELGLTRERIRQIENKALAKLRGSEYHDALRDLLG